MSIYGDMGNIIALKYRLKKYGFKPVYKTVNPGEDLPTDTDIYFMGGGQDQEQFEIFKDLMYKKKQLINDIEDNVSLLAICGGYQLLGEKFTTGDGLIIDGVGVFDVITTAPDTNVKSRCVGNILTECLIPDLLGEKLIGFENHSGQTKFSSNKKCKPLAKVIVGFGNNIEKKYEGCVYKNAIGTYLHGSCLPKNPVLADYLIFQAIRRQAEKNILDPKIYIETRKIEIDDDIVQKLREQLLVKILKR
jgi:CobQ-like glutamine amidotransferase family enzyme